MTAEEYLVAAMNAAGLPGAKVAEMLRDLGPERALMSGSAVLHAIISAEGGDPPGWAPGDFDIFVSTRATDDYTNVTEDFVRGLRDAHAGLEVGPAGHADDYQWWAGEAVGKSNRQTSLDGAAGRIQFIEWTADPQTPIDNFDFRALRSTFDGTAIRSPPGVAELISSRQLWPAGAWPEHVCETPEGLTRFAGRLLKYHSRGFADSPATIRVRRREHPNHDPYAADISAGPLPLAHPLSGLYYVESWDDSLAGARVLRGTGRNAKAARSPQ